MKSKKNYSSKNIVQFLLGISILVFSGILFFSTSTQQIETLTTFKDRVNISNYQGNYVIGEYKIENTGMLSKRVILPQFVACDEKKQRIELSYSHSDHFSPIFNGNSQEYIDVKGKSSQTLKITSYQRFIGPRKENQSQNQNFETYYIFSTEPSQRYNYDECMNKDFSKAITTITLEQ